MTVLAQSQAAIDRFVDVLWIEDGLAALTLAAYRRDLSLYADWLMAASSPPRLDSLSRRSSMS